MSFPSRGLCALLLALGALVAAAQDNPVGNTTLLTPQAAGAVIPTQKQLPFPFTDPAALAADGAERDTPPALRRGRPAEPAAPGTVAIARKTSLKQAREGFAQAVPYLPVSQDDGQALPAGVSPAAVCGTNSLTATGYIADCHIVSFWRVGGATTCSAFKISSYYLGTAGHCVYSSPKGGWATSINVYCTGANGCPSTRTTYATRLASTYSWVNRPQDHNSGNIWDMAAIKVASLLPGTAYSVGQYGSQATRNVMVTGYPSQNTESTACNSGSFYNACRQYSSSDVLTSYMSGYYKSSSLDFCRGHSGSGIWDRNYGWVSAVVSSASTSPCINNMTPQINRAYANSNCERAAGGASLYCLMAKIP